MHLSALKSQIQIDTEHNLRAIFSASSELESALTDDSIVWQRILRHTGDTLTTPYIRDTLAAENKLNRLPEDVLSAFELIHQANLDRNRKVINAFRDFTQVVNAVGVQPLPLKGIALLVQDGFYSLGARIVSDIDILISQEDLERTLRALTAADYVQSSNQLDPISLDEPCVFNPIDINDFRNQPQFSKHHIPPVKARNSDIAIEIHFDVTPPLNSQTLDQHLNQWATQQLTIEHGHGVTFRTAENLFHLMHTFFHSQINDEQQYLATVDLRHLLDVKTILENEQNRDTSSSTDRDNLLREGLEIARQHSLNTEFNVFLWQLDYYCGVKTQIEVANDVETAAAISTFQAVQHNRAWYRLRRSVVWLTRRWETFSNPQMPHFRYGPISWQRKLAKYTRYLLFKVIAALQRKLTQV